MTMRSLSALALLFAAPAAVAQTLIVDINNGPGTTYTSLVDAAASAPDGAVLEVRPGFYFGAALVDGKSLTILFDPGAVIATDTDSIAMRVRNLNANQWFTMRGATVQTSLLSLSPYAEVRCEDSAGPVMIEQLATQVGNFRARISAYSCDQMIVRDSSFNGTLHFDDSRVALEGTSVGQNFTFTAAVTVAGGELQVLGGTFAGFNSTQGPAFDLQAADLRLLGDALIYGGVNGSGSARVAPSVTFASAPSPFSATIAVTNVEMPHVSTVSEPLGTPFDATLAGQTGVIGLIVGGNPSTPLTAPIFGDAWWVDPLGGVPLQAGVTPFATTVTIAANPALIGTRLNFQGLTWTGAQFDVSNPSGWVAR